MRRGVDALNELTHASFADARPLYERTAPGVLRGGATAGSDDAAAAALVGPTRVQARLNLAVPSIGLPARAVRTLFEDGGT